jgi:N-acetylmuramoyl-L-alanine amidase
MAADRAVTMVGVRTVAQGALGEPVVDIQSRLAALGFAVDAREHARFGPATERAVRAFQQSRQLMVDGKVGPHTWQELVEAGYALGDRALYLRLPSYRGDDVRALQAGLNLLGFDAGREDGIFGERTDRALREFQHNVGLPPDGIAGATTLEAIRRLRPVSPGPGRATVRELEALRRLSATLQSARIAVDAGHGSDDPGSVGPTGLRESEAAYTLAQALIGELRVRGANPVVLRTESDDPGPSERARTANQAGAEVLVSIHLNSHEDPSAEGACTFYYGHERWSSAGGQRLAELIQDELTSRLGLRDGRIHPMALPLLRETRMPAVHVEPCFISNPHEEALLRQQAFRGRVATAVARGIERFFRGREEPHTPSGGGEPQPPAADPSPS